MVRTGRVQFGSGENGRLCSSQQQPPRKVPPAGRQDAAGVPDGSSDAGTEALAEQGLCAGRTPLCCRLAGLVPLSDHLEDAMTPQTQVAGRWWDLSLRPQTPLWVLWSRVWSGCGP